MLIKTNTLLLSHAILNVAVMSNAEIPQILSSHISLISDHVFHILVQI